MPPKADQKALIDFDEHIKEIADAYYDGNKREAFRHAAFQILAPDPTLSDEQVIEMTAIDKSGDLEVDGWFVDEESETVFLLQSAGGKSRVPESKVTKFWLSPDELLNKERVNSSSNQSVRELSTELDARLAENYRISMILASRGGFAPAARAFAGSRADAERQFTSLNDDPLACRCTFRLVEKADVAEALDDFRTGIDPTVGEVNLSLDGRWTYQMGETGLKSMRATVPANEIVRVFKDNRFKLFSLNPRGPLANAKVNRNIEETLSNPKDRINFHLLNNGMCATCEDFTLNQEKGTVAIKSFQIVNGCQTTVTLEKFSVQDLKETYVDLKLVVAKVDMANRIAQSSNSQNALRDRDHASFEKQQRLLQYEFEGLKPSWFYEIKQGYWKAVLTEKQRARYKTGGPKRHIEVQAMAQASLAFLGEPSVALDRVRYVFRGIRSAEDRVWYEKAFPPNVRAQQLILPWVCLRYIQRQRPFLRFSKYHILWQIGTILREHYGVTKEQYFSSELSVRLASVIDSWLPDRFQVANVACRQAFRRARQISGEELEVRDFLRGRRDFGGINSSGLILEACKDELEFMDMRNGDGLSSLP